ncbi:MAG: VWA domain-containing protein [Planctomycetes bacterium]|nr:VWA domain-containing protein [Planctomycetota bacterium]
MLPFAFGSFQAAPQQPESLATEATTHVEETFRLLNAPPLWVTILVVLPLTALFAYWSYSGLTRLERPTRIALSCLRWLAILVCLVLLFQPAFETTTYRKTRHQVHVLIDDSASMQRKDRYPDEEQRDALTRLVPGDIGARTRQELVAAILERDDGLLKGLEETHDVRLFRLQRKPVPIRSLAQMTSRGNRTALGDALDLHLASTGNQNLEGVILISDGRNNAGLDPVEVAESYGMRGLPIYTIGVGDPEPPRNAWIVGPPGPKEALREEEVGFDVTLRAEGLAGKNARVELFGSRDGGPFQPLAVQQGELPKDGESQRLRVFHAFREAGDWTLRFELAPQDNESQLDDNQDVRFLRVNDERIRVLYAQDLPTWEYRYIVRGLKRVDPSIQVQAYLADASPRFVQEHSPELEPLQALPRTEKELLQYHVILLGEFPPERIANTEEGIRNWLELLVKFVEFGGGIGFLAGFHPDGFSQVAMPEAYRNTPLQDLLPVVLEDPVWMMAQKREPLPPFRPVLDNPLQPNEILMLQRDPALNRRLWEEGLPGFEVYHPVQRAKPGATVLLRHPFDENAYGKRPIAVVAPYPRGNTFFLATDETFRWRDPYGEIYQDAFWRNVVRYLAQGRLQRRNDLLELSVDKLTIETGDKVRVQLRMLDAELQPAVNNEQPVYLRNQQNDVEKRVLRAVPGEPGSYQASFTMTEAGAYSFLVFANDNPADTVLAREDVLVKVPDQEMSQSSQDRATLERIAEASQSADGAGKYVFLADAGALIEDFRSHKAYESREDTHTRPVWDSLWSLLALLSILGVEWLLRKRARLV